MRERVAAAALTHEAEKYCEAAALAARQAEEERDAAIEATGKAEEDRRAAAAERAESARLWVEQEATIARQQREVEDLRAAAVIERDAAAHLRIDLDVARAVMIASRDRAAADAIAAARTRQEAEIANERARREAAAAGAEISAERAAIAVTRDRIEEARRHDGALLALLARAADDRAGLNLRLAGDTFAIGPHGLTDDEHATKKKGWPKPLMAMARALAGALDRVRAVARQLDQREQAVEERATAIAERDARLARLQAEREAQLGQDRAAHDARVATHRRAVADLDRRDTALKAEECRIADARAAAEAQRKAAATAQASAEATLRDHRRWIEITDAMEANPQWVEVGPGGRLVLDRYVAAADPTLKEAFESTPPAWFVSLSVQRLELADALRRADDREKGAAYAAERLEAMIAKAGPVLTHAQQGITDEAVRTVRRYRPQIDGWDR